MDRPGVVSGKCGGEAGRTKRPGTNFIVSGLYFCSLQYGLGILN